MKITLLSAADISGGAYKAAYRLHRGLLQKGLDSKMLVGKKTTDDYTVLRDAKTFRRRVQELFPLLENLVLKLYPKRKKVIFSTSLISSSILKRLNSVDSHIIHLQWINNSFFSIKTISKIKHPIIWTIHDMWIFTGGCHYSGNCENYVTGCRNCPILDSNKKNDLANFVFTRKINYWKQLNLTVVSPSKWLAECAKKSLILKDIRIEVIPYNIDTSIYKPIDKSFARNIFNLPSNKTLILFGATNGIGDPRKGVKHLIDVIKILSATNSKDIAFVIFGSSAPKEPLLENIEFHYMGELKDNESLAALYSSSDVFIAPSIEDNLPLTVMESLSCGTPVVAFNIGGMRDMIDHKSNGYLAKPFDAEDLVNGINWILEDSNRKLALDLAARKKVLDNYTTDIIVDKYNELYNEVLNKV